MANRLYFTELNSTMARAYDFSGNRQAADDIDLVSTSWLGGFATANRLYLINFSANFARAFDHSGTRQAAEDINLGSGRWRGGAATSSRLYFIDDTANYARAYDYSRNRQAASDINLGNGNWEGGFATSDRLYFVDNSADYARAYDHSGTRQAASDINLGRGGWNGGIASDSRLYFIESNRRSAHAYDFSRNRQAASDINLGTGSWSGGFAIIENLVATTLAVVSGNNQSASVSTALANPLIVQVNDQNGNAFAGATVSFSTTGGTLSSGTATTDSNGRASVTLRMPSTAGSVTVTASVSGIATRVTFTATATAATPPAPVVAKDRMFFLDDTTNAARAYDFSRSRQTADDISLDDVAWKGIVASDDRLFFLGGNRAYAYDFAGNRKSTEDITFSGNPTGGVSSDDRMYFILGETAQAYDFDRNRQSGNDITLGTGAWRGGVATDDRLYFVNNRTNTAVAYDFDRNRQTADDISLPAAGWQGGVASEDRLYFINFTASQGVAYDFDGVRQSADDINLGTGSWQGGTSTFAAPAAAATFTISTTDTDIRAGETVNFSIASDIDVTDFLASDITVTGGTRGTLTGSGQNWTLSVVAGAAGTLRIAIAAGVVSPGNAAASQDFTVNALVSFAISTTDTDIRVGESVSIAVVASESITGFAAGDITVTDGTRGALTGSGRNYVLTVTAGSAGTMTIAIAENVVTPKNAAARQEFTINPLDLSFGSATISDRVYVVGDRDSFTLPEATGGVGAKTYSVSRLPTGFSFNAARRGITVNASAVVSTVTVTYIVRDSNTPTPNIQRLTFDVTVNAALSFGTTIVTDKVYTIGDTGSFTLPPATGGIGARTYSVMGLPTGFSFNPSTRAVTIAPQAVVSTTEVTYIVTDSDSPSNRDTLTFDITVNAATLTLSFSDAEGQSGSSTTLQIMADRDVTGLALTDFRLSNGSLSNLQGSGRSYSATLTFPLTGAGTTTVQLIADAVDQGNAVVNAMINYIPQTLPPATEAPEFVAVAKQRILLNTDYRLSVRVNHVPDWVRVRGLYERDFSYDYRRAEGVVYIVGHPTREVSNQVWEVTGGNSFGTANPLDVEYDVVSPMPTITDIGRIKLWRGVPLNIRIPIDSFNSFTADGLLVGMGHTKDETAGILLGEIPENAEFTATEGTFLTTAKSSGGEDSHTFTFDLESGSPPAMNPVSFTRAPEGVRFSWEAVTDATSYAYRIGTGSWVDVGNVTSFLLTNRALGTYVLQWRVNGPWIGNPVSVSVTINLTAYFGVANTGNAIPEFRAYNLLGGVTLQKTFNPLSAAYDDEYLPIDLNRGYFSNLNGHEIVEVALPTATMGSVSRVKRIRLPNTFISNLGSNETFPSSVNIIGNNMYFTDRSAGGTGGSTRLMVADINVADNAEALYVKTLNMPDSIRIYGVSVNSDEVTAYILGDGELSGRYVYFCDISASNGGNIVIRKSIRLPSDVVGGGSNIMSVTADGNIAYLAVTGDTTKISALDISGVNESTAMLIENYVVSMQRLGLFTRFWGIVAS